MSQSLEKTWTSIHTITRDIACDVAREIACVISSFSVALGDGSLLDEENERNALRTSPLQIIFLCQK